ncbi:hypothetical protein D3C86_1074570 [compost metagenome]
MFKGLAVPVVMVPVPGVNPAGPYSTSNNVPVLVQVNCAVVGVMFPTARFVGGRQDGGVTTSTV